MSETMTRNKYGSDMEKPVKHKNMASGKEVLGHALVRNMPVIRKMDMLTFLTHAISFVYER